MMGAMSISKSLSLLHAECEVLIWAMECTKIIQISEVKFTTNSSQLVKEFLRCKEFFYVFTMQHIPGIQNTRQISWHEVLEISLMLWFMMTQFPRIGSRIRNQLSFVSFFVVRITQKCQVPSGVMSTRAYTTDSDNKYITINMGFCSD